ncbi:MAG: DEAD/DEAH box helicase [Desulfobacteraceae bacterium]|nr:MAG: DEAD/DEAH box helicase [Desulfobacteraceae bacterium]
MKFDKYPIASTIKANLVSLGYKRPTDIQYKAIPSIMKGEDVLAIAQTGTGKTAAFAIPVVNKIEKAKRSKRSPGVTCIVMVPTRELASQIAKVFNQLSKKTRVKTLAVYGGIEQDPQIKKLAKGVDILVATPGRMFDLISQGAISLKRVDTLILDEADQMLDLGFIDDIKAIKQKLRGKHQTLFFSATINPEIKKLAFSQVKSSAIRIQISPDDPVSKNVSHFVMFVEMDDKRFFLRQFINDHEDAKMLVFVRTRVRAERVAKALERKEIVCATLHGEKEQDLRNRVMDQFKSDRLKILIATDVSARGIDVSGIDFVINYDLPEKTENYVHRVGRTGRGFEKGVAISFCSSEEKEQLDTIQAFLNKEIETIPITKKAYQQTMDTSTQPDDIQSLIKEHEAWEKSKKKKKR